MTNCGIIIGVSNLKDDKFEFYESDTYGLIRVRSNERECCHPEIVKDGKWVKGSQYIMDAVIGMGEDPYSSGGDIALPISEEKAALMAETMGIGLFSKSNE